jgi:hypothetical protein
MSSEYSSIGDTQVIPTERPQGFVDSCISLIENLLEERMPTVQPEPSEPTRG